MAPSLRHDWLHALGAGLLLLAVYAASAPGTVLMEDDGSFILSSYTLGIEHPPGYPLYILLGKLFTYLPFGSVAYRVHLASALFGALACVLLWMCARLLGVTRLPAYLAALGLGLSPVYWSQALIADVYTLNTLFFVVLLYLALRARARLLPAIALAFGLSMSNHWPLMLLAAPAFAVLLWPMRQELAKRAGLLVCLALIGLAPYAWLVQRSWQPLAASFYGPLETLPEIWHFVSRAGYAGVDASPTGGGLDRLRFLVFALQQLGLQFAVLGTLLAALGFAVQWRTLGRRVAIALTLACLLPTLSLVMLLQFDYDAMFKHVFQVYLLPTYAVAALWMALGCQELMQRLRPACGFAAAGIVLPLIAALGVRANVLPDTGWAARYAGAVLGALPPHAVLFVHGDLDMPAIAYLHLVERVRPDVTLYNARGLMLGNRLFHPLRTTPQEANHKLRDFIEEQRVPVTFTTEQFTGRSQRERWLFAEVDRASSDARRMVIDVPEEALRFFERSVLAGAGRENAWVAHHQDQLRRRYAALLGQRLALGEPMEPRVRRHLDALSQDFYGALGIAEGLLQVAGAPLGVVADMLARAGDLMPGDVRKIDRSKFFELAGTLKLRLAERDR